MKKYKISTRNPEIWAQHDSDHPIHAHESLLNNKSRFFYQMLTVWVMILSCLLFSLMGVFVKLASAHYSFGELVFYRSLIGVFLMLGTAHAQGGSLLTKYPGGHLLRSSCGAVALCLWFYSIEKLPLATAMTLNYTAPIWMALFVIPGLLSKGLNKTNPLLLLSVAVGFFGVILILQPTILDDQWWGGFIGLLSGFMSALAFLQVAALGKVNEPGYRVVFYFSLAGVILGAAMVIAEGGFSHHTSETLLLLVAMGVLAAAAQWSLTYALLNGKTLINASLQYLTIAFSGAFGGLIFGEKMTLAATGGMALVVASGVIAARFRDPAVRGPARIPSQ